MSKARLVITAVVLEGRSQSEVARTYGVSQPWISRLVARYRAEGEAAFEPRSRAPHRSPTATAPEVVDLVLGLRKDLTGQGLDAGPHTLCWHLAQRRQITVSAATVSRILTRHGQVTPEPKKRPRASYLRFAAELPNQMWQTDFTHYRLSTGQDVEILNFLDDHSRLLLACTAFDRVTGPAVVEVFRAAIDQHGVPASVLSDNGMVFTTRFAGGRAGRNARNGFESELARHRVVQKNSSPNHPQTCGKIERFHQTLKNWLRARPAQPATLTQLQARLEVFTGYYNQQRPHRSLSRQTPLAAYLARPKATPATAAADQAESDTRIRRDRIDDTGAVTLRYHGRLHHIGIGRAHARTHVLLLVQNRDIRVVDSATGELLRELVLDPTRDYQPRGTPRTAKRPNP
jgi:transposase InsO family protein